MRRTLSAAAALAIMVFVASCGGETRQGGSASDSLARYFDAAQAVDRDLAKAAALINKNFHPDPSKPLIPDKATAQAVEAADPDRAAKELPAGLPAKLLQAVLVVHSELVSRRAALNGIWEGGAECFRNGAPAAARFPDDLAAARNLAAALASSEVAAPDSPAAAELAVRLREIDARNLGCGSCGGAIIRRSSLLPQIRWGAGVPWGMGPRGPRTNQYGGPVYDGGRIEYPDRGYIQFNAEYTEGSGWKVELNAC